MCGEYEGPIKAYERLGIEQLRLPTDDHFEPALADMSAAVRFIAEHKVKKEKVAYCTQIAVYL
jgi:protein-tyrosine phosphatase